MIKGLLIIIIKSLEIHPKTTHLRILISITKMVRTPLYLQTDKIPI